MVLFAASACISDAQHAWRVGSESPASEVQGDSDADADSDSDSDADTDSEGLVSGVVTFTLYRYACDECFGVESEYLPYAGVAVHEPLAVGWLDHFPEPGGCLPWAGWPVPVDEFWDAGGDVYLSTTERTIELARNAEGIYANAGLATSNFEYESVYSLTAPGGSQVEGLWIPSAFTSPGGLDALTPAELLYTSEAEAFSPLQAEDFRFEWAPSGSEALVAVLVMDADVEGDNGVICVARDRPPFRIPEEELSAFVGSRLAVYFLRVTLGSVTSPAGGSIETAAVYGVIGSATLVDWI